MPSLGLGAQRPSGWILCRSNSFCCWLCRILERLRCSASNTLVVSFIYCLFIFTLAGKIWFVQWEWGPTGPWHLWRRPCVTHLSKTRVLTRTSCQHVAAVTSRRSSLGQTPLQLIFFPTSLAFDGKTPHWHQKQRWCPWLLLHLDSLFSCSWEWKKHLYNLTLICCSGLLIFFLDNHSFTRFSPFCKILCLHATFSMSSWFNCTFFSFRLKTFQSELVLCERAALS